MVALEAMERARPVIAAAIGGLGELVRDGETGLLVAPGEAEPLATAIVRARRRPRRWRREMGAAGRRARAARLPRGALHRADGDPLRGALDGARAERPLVDRERPRRPSARPRTPSRARRGPASPHRSPLRRVAEQRDDAPRRARPRRPAGRAARSRRRRRARDRADVARRRPASRRASPRAARARSPPSAPGGRAARRGGSQRRHVADAAGQVARARRRRARARALERPRSRPIAEHDAASRPRTRASARIATSTPFCCSSRETQSRTRASSGSASSAGSAPRLGQRVEPVVDDLDLRPPAGRPRST